jgi:hypothetical protein
MERLLKYGLCADDLKHVLQVENGLACNCVCPNCNHPLIAKNNPTNKKAAHFAHQSGKECEGAIETALHLLAKSILQKTKRLTLPDYHYDYDPFNDESVFRESENLTFENIILEKAIDIEGEKIIPDAIGEINNRQIFIEFANTHFIDHNKKEKLKSLQIACVEIDLSEQILEEESLISFFNSDTSSKYWIINPRLDKKYADYKKQLEKEYAEHKKKLSDEKKLRDRQKAIEAENNKKESEAKYERYKNDKNYKLLLLKDGEIKNCPLKKEALNELKNSHFYRHLVLKKIIDGEYWNGEFYGRMPNGKWIFVNQEKIIVYPPDNMRECLTEQENKANNLLFAGLKSIKSILENPTFGACKKCKFSVDYFSLRDNAYEVCKHPNN